MCNRWKSGRDLPFIRAAGRYIPLMTRVCSMAKANSKLLSCFFSQGKFYAEQLEPLRGVLILDSLKGAQYMKVPMQLYGYVSAKIKRVDCFLEWASFIGCQANKALVAETSAVQQTGREKA